MDHNLYAINSDGTLKWKFTAGNAIRRSAAAVGADGKIYFGSWDGNLYALTDRGTGPELKWAFETGHVMDGSPAIGANGTIYFGSGNGKLYGLTDEGASATEKWYFATGWVIESSPAIAADGTIYVGSDDGNFYALTDHGSYATTKWAMMLSGPLRRRSAPMARFTWGRITACSMR